MGQSFDSLPSKERSRRYREMADDAFHKARQSSDPDHQAECLGRAMGWHAMALELEADIRHLAQLEASQARLEISGKQPRSSP